MGALDPYSGVWDERKATHLMRRATFSASKKNVAILKGKSPTEAVDMLLTPLTQQPPHPVDPATGTTWVTSITLDGAKDGAYRAYVRAWWMDLILKGDLNITEKLTLFWHNHFATEADVVTDSRFTYWNNVLLRTNCLGNFKTLAKLVTTDQAMLRYLNGNENTNKKPNENYARELQELFTIGKGIQRAEGDYTTYTEDDVREAARVLTGWQALRNSLKSNFNQSLHDTKDKTFSAAYGNTVIKGRSGSTAGEAELDDLLTMIFSQNATSEYIVKKLYRWFVHYNIDSTIETEVIKPLAAQLRANNFEVKSVIRTLLLSNHFYEEQNIGAMIKSPMDLLAGTFGEFDLYTQVKAQTASNQILIYGALMKLMGDSLNMLLLDPPSVAGWQAYYQSPDYYRQWVNHFTLVGRYSFVDTVLTSSRYGVKIDLIAFAKAVTSSPEDPTELIKAVTDTLLPAYNATKEELDYLANTVIMRGAPAYEWTEVWNTYIKTPDNAVAKRAVENSLKDLINFVMRMAEYQLM